MKKMMVAFSLAFLSTSAFATTNHCEKFANSPRYLKAIEAVAKYQERTLEDFCTRVGMLEIEAQPSRIITPNGDVIPHVSIQQHFSWDSCKYLVNEIDYSITNVKCYSGF